MTGVADTPERWPFAALLRHQAAAFAATLVDFAGMVALVEIVAVTPAAAAAGGACAGAVVTFTLGRRWVFQATETPIRRQAIRYALVSGAGAALNALGEHLALRVFPVHYLAARAVIALGVSLVWSFPMQQRVVFSADVREIVPTRAEPAPERDAA